MISKTKIDSRMLKKTNPELVSTIFLAKKKGHLKLAKKISCSTRQQLKLNLYDLNNFKEDKILIPGKILGEGKVNKKISIIALGFSKDAIQKLKNASCDVNSIKKELEQNPELKGVKVHYGKDSN